MEVRPAGLRNLARDQTRDHNDLRSFRVYSAAFLGTGSFALESTTRSLFSFLFEFGLPFCEAVRKSSLARDSEEPVSCVFSTDRLSAMIVI